MYSGERVTDPSIGFSNTYDHTVDLPASFVNELIIRTVSETRIETPFVEIVDKKK